MNQSMIYTKLLVLSWYKNWPNNILLQVTKSILKLHKKSSLLVYPKRRTKQKRNRTYLHAGEQRHDAMVLGENRDPVMALGFDVQDGQRLNISCNKKEESYSGGTRNLIPTGI